MGATRIRDFAQKTTARGFSDFRHYMLLQIGKFDIKERNHYNYRILVMKKDLFVSLNMKCQMNQRWKNYLKLILLQIN